MHQNLIPIFFKLFKNLNQKHTETHRNSTQSMLSQTKTSSFLRDSAIFETTVQFPVNPYVTGSSPVARATDYNPSQIKVGRRVFSSQNKYFFLSIQRSIKLISKLLVFLKLSNRS